jgi:hypothetical protein
VYFLLHAREKGCEGGAKGQRAAEETHESLLVEGYKALAINSSQAVSQWRECNASDTISGVLRNTLEGFAVENADVFTGSGDVAAAWIEGNEVHTGRS